MNIEWKSYVYGPVRVQLRRTKGWEMPPNTVKVDRSTKWGNPFQLTEDRDAAAAVTAFRRWLTVRNCAAEMPQTKGRILYHMPDLRGKNLACWCDLDKPCHADVLLELANAGVKP